MPPKVEPAYESDSDEETPEKIQQYCCDQYFDLWMVSNRKKPQPKFEDFAGKKPLTDDEFDYKYFIKNEFDTDSEDDEKEETLID